MAPHAIIDDDLSINVKSSLEQGVLIKSAKTTNGYLKKRPLRPDFTSDLNGYTVTDTPYTYDGKQHLSPGVARASVVATNAAPSGTTEDDWVEKHKHLTPLQQHSIYWDPENTGVIYPAQTYRGLRAWGWRIPLAALVTVIIHLTLSYGTSSSWLPSLSFPIYISRIHRSKHGSDSTSYDNQGRFRPMAFEEFFSQYDKGEKGGLDVSDLYDAWRGQRNTFDFFGWVGFVFEWWMTWLLLWPSDGVMRIEDVRRVLDGSIFQKKADEWAAKQKTLSTFR